MSDLLPHRYTVIIHAIAITVALALVSGYLRLQTNSSSNPPSQTLPLWIRLR